MLVTAHTLMIDEDFVAAIQSHRVDHPRQGRQGNALYLSIRLDRLSEAPVQILYRHQYRSASVFQTRLQRGFRPPQKIKQAKIYTVARGVKQA
jgi:hypothetical protein